MRPEPTPDKLSPELLEALRGIKAVLRQFPKGALLFEQGFPVTGVYLVESGEVRVLLPYRHYAKPTAGGCGAGNETWAEREHQRRKL